MAQAVSCCHDLLLILECHVLFSCVCVCVFVTEYRLHGFVSHMGTSTACGHYVCHIKKEGVCVCVCVCVCEVALFPPLQVVG